MKRFAIVFGMACAAVLFSAGCGGIKDLDKAVNEVSVPDEISSAGIELIRNKTTRDEVLNAIGAPTLVCKNELNGESWVYTKVAVRDCDTGFRMRANFVAAFPYQSHSLSRGGGLAGVGAGAEVGSNRSSYKTAGLTIKFNAKGRVNSYEFTATSF